MKVLNRNAYVANINRMITRFLHLCAFLLIFVSSQSWSQTGLVYDPSPLLVNLQETKLVGVRGPCLDASEPDACLWSEINAQLTKMRNTGAPAILGLDIYVPGTKDEDGDATQFMALLEHKGEDRLALTLKYQPATKLDSARYGDGVKTAANALTTLLDAINGKSGISDIQVYGHSKGAHAVSNVASTDRFSNIKFFATGQPGATPKEDLGTPGYMHKLSQNLVGITWANDEVQYYKGIAVFAPEIFQIPGLANSRKRGGTMTTISRIDHHTTYGGDYSQDGYPYCAAGSGLSWKLDEACKQTRVKFAPFLWGNKSCFTAAMRLMQTGRVGEKKYIGHSGPRGECVLENGNKADEIRVTEAILKYRIKNPGKNCKVDASFEFLTGNASLDGRGENAPKMNISASDNMQDFKELRLKDFDVPNHMRLKIETHVRSKNGQKGWIFKRNNCASALPVQIEIDTLKFQFDNPATDVVEIGDQHFQYVIRGRYEGDGYPGKITGRENTAWNRKNSGGQYDDMDMFNTPNYIKISSASVGGKFGVFYKDLHLID